MSSAAGTFPYYWQMRCKFPHQLWKLGIDLTYPKHMEMPNSAKYILSPYTGGMITTLSVLSSPSQQLVFTVVPGIMT